MKIKRAVKNNLLILAGLVLSCGVSNGFAASDTSNVLSTQVVAAAEDKSPEEKSKEVKPEEGKLKEEKNAEGFSPAAPAGADEIGEEAAVASGRISLDLRSIEISEALRFLAMRAKLNMVINKSVSGRLYLILNDVPVKDVLDIIILSSDLAYDRQGEIYQIMTAAEYKTKYGRSFSDERQVKIFRLQNAVPDNVFSAIEVFKSEIGRILVDKESGMVLVMETPENMAKIEKVISTLDQKRVIRSFSLQYAKAKDVEERLKPQLNEKGTGTVQADERTNQVIVQAFPGRMDQIEALIKTLDKKTKEVLIVSKIIKVTLLDTFEAEIQWEGLFRDINLLPGYQQGYLSSHVSNPVDRIGQTFVDDFVNMVPSTTDRLTAGAKVYPTENITIGQIGEGKAYEVLFKFLQTIGDSRVLSSPRITVTNNQEAKIHVGTREAYVTSTTTKGSGGGGDTIAESINFVDVGIELSVTPTINDDGFITMKIKPAISNVKRTLETATGNQIPIIDTSEAESTVMVKDNSSIVIAGLRKDEFTDADQRVPYFSNLPVFGALFKSSSKKKERTEVLVFLTPHITGGENLLTGNPSMPTDHLNDYRGYSSLSLDKKIRSGDSPGLVTKIIKKLPFTSHD